jgi:hypothetical protein
MEVVRVRSLIAAAALAGCSSSPVTVIAPIIDVPVAADVDATASDLDSITLSVNRDGSSEDLDSHSFPHGETLDLPGVPFGDDLALHMSGFLGQTLVGYGRTCAVSVTPTGPVPQPHLFFSRTVKFATIDLTLSERRDGLGISFAGGAVFAGGVAASTAGGTDDVAVLTLEQYDPMTNGMSSLAIGDHRSGAIALLGASPQVVVLGGESDDAKLVEFVDGDAVNRIEFASLARGDLTATSLVDGRILVVGGTMSDQPVDAKTGRPPPSGEIDEIDLTQAVHELPTQLSTPRSMHSATRFGNDVGAPVLIVGGLGPDGKPIASAELFKPLSDSLAASSFNPQLNFPRYRHLAMLLPDESVLVIGGLDANGQPVHTMERFSVDAGFQKVADLPGDAGVIDAVATPLPDGRILLTGGRQTADADALPLSTAYIIRFDPNNGAIDVIGTDHLAVPRAGHQAALLCDGTVLISGGTQGQHQAERYNPPPDGRQ